MADLNTTISFLMPYYSTVEQVIGTISLFVGGIFGIYLISLIIRIYFFKKILDYYKSLKGQVELLNEKIDRLGKKK